MDHGPLSVFRLFGIIIIGKFPEGQLCRTLNQYDLFLRISNPNIRKCLIKTAKYGAYSVVRTLFCEKQICCFTNKKCRPLGIVDGDLSTCM